MDRSLITKGKFMVMSGGTMTNGKFMEPPSTRRDRPPPDNIEELRARLERVQNAIDFVRGDEPAKGDRIQWLLDRGYI